jgi:DNA-binding transcriptional regulator YhcF (GntR family)
MNSHLDEQYGLPYYIQLKNILKTRIQSGGIGSNKLPPVRQVAKDFSVSVNTVLRAYNELGREGIVTGAVGRGTFVNISLQELKSHNRQIIMRKIIEHSLEEALSLDFSMEEFQNAVTGYIEEKKAMMEKLQLVFIECNIEQIISSWIPISGGFPSSLRIFETKRGRKFKKRSIAT